MKKIRKTNKRIINYSMDEEILTMIDEMSKVSGMSKSLIVREAVKEYLLNRADLLKNHQAKKDTEFKNLFKEVCEPLATGAA